MCSFVEVSSSDTSLVNIYFNLVFLVNHMVILHIISEFVNSFGDKYQYVGEIL
jgi:hypothetical protein